MCLVSAFLVGTAAAFAGTIQEIDENEDGVTDQWIETVDGEVTSIRKDLDFDGQADYFLAFDELALKVYEELDFNRDGHMDDFYYYSEGVLRRREVDTNFDKAVDLWVTIREGVYVGKIERDTDFDGKPDYVKTYGSE